MVSKKKIVKKVRASVPTTRLKWVPLESKQLMISRDRFNEVLGYVLDYYHDIHVDGGGVLQHRKDVNRVLKSYSDFYDYIQTKESNEPSLKKGGYQ